MRIEEEWALSDAYRRTRPSASPRESSARRLHPPSPHRRGSPRCAQRLSWRLAGLSAAVRHNAQDYAHRPRRRRRDRPSCSARPARWPTQSGAVAAVRHAQSALCANGRQRIHALIKVRRSCGAFPGVPARSAARSFLRAVHGLLANCKIGSCARSAPRLRPAPVPRACLLGVLHKNLSPQLLAKSRQQGIALIQNIRH